VTGGCGTSADVPGPQGSPQWEKVLTTAVSGKEPVKLDLGLHKLGSAVRLAWVLTGPEDSPATLTFRITNAEKGVSYNHVVSRALDPSMQLQDEDAVTLAPIWPGPYRIYFGQRFPPGKGPGWDAKLTVYTVR
jgi:hypothetical protein